MFMLKYTYNISNYLVLRDHAPKCETHNDTNDSDKYICNLFP